MANIVVVGMQWGDEGKGKIVDLLCPAFDAVVRYQGGHNAGHTVKFGDRHFALRLIPSGILHAGMRCVMGNGMVVSPEAFLEEIDQLHEAGVTTEGRLFVSNRAQALLPVHAALDQAREQSSSARDKIGTTARGIGPAYEMKAARYGVRLGELAADGVEARLRSQLGRARARARGARRRALPGFRRGPRTSAGSGRASSSRISPTPSTCSTTGSSAARASCSKARRERCSTSITAPIRTSRAPTRPRAAPATGTGVPPTAIDGVARRPQGLHDAGRRRTVPGRAPRRRGRVPAQARQRVRHRDRPAAPLRLVRRRRGALRAPPERRQAASRSPSSTSSTISTRSRSASPTGSTARRRASCRRGSTGSAAPSRSSRRCRAGSARPSASSTRRSCRRRRATTSTSSSRRSAPKSD